jgi:hypothetical protein
MFEVMDKEWPLIWLLSLFVGLGLIGFFVCRGRPVLSFLFVPLLTLLAWSQVSELTDPHVGPAIRQQAGIAYVAGSYVLMATGPLLPIVGTLLGKLRRRKAISS